MLFVIVGATGHTGRVAAEELLAAGKQVRVLGRDLGRLRLLTSKGAEGLAARVDNKDELVRAFSGAAAVYALIPPPPMDIQNFRAYQNRAADALIAAIRETGIKHVVALSSIGAEHQEGTGPVTGLHDFEQKLRTLKDVNVLMLRAAFFMENSLATMGLIKGMGINGGSTRADVALPMIAAKDIGVYAVRRLAALDFYGYQVQDLLGNRDLTWNEVTAIIGKAIGKPDLKYVTFSYDDAINGMVSMGLPRVIAESYTELSRGANEGRVRGTESRSPQNTTPTTFEEFVRDVFVPAYNR
jgi:uncharacterized protein YbjT (DUF2867 family)